MNHTIVLDIALFADGLLLWSYCAVVLCVSVWVCARLVCSFCIVLCALGQHAVVVVSLVC